MTRCNSGSRGSALVGVVLLLVAVLIAVAAVLFLRGGAAPNKVAESSSVGNVAKKTPETPAKDLATRERGAQEATNKAAHPIKFSVKCMGPTGVADPLKQVTVRAVALKGMGLDESSAVVKTTDDEGIARFEDLPFEAYQIDATPKGYYPVTQTPVKDGENLSLVFGKGVPFTGKVRSAKGDAPIEKAFVSVMSYLGGDAASVRLQAAARAGKDLADYKDLQKAFPYTLSTSTTAADGTFSFPAIPLQQKVRVSFEHPLFDPLQEEFEVSKEEPVAKEFVLLPRVAVVGRIVADETGEPIPGVKVQASDIPMNVILMFGRESAEISEGVSDANGNYELKSVPRGKSYLYVHYPGFDDYVTTIEIKTQEERFQQEIRLARAASVQGTVVDAANTPVEGASIYWIYPEAAFFLSQALAQEPAARTAADGSFTLRNMPIGKPFHILAVHPDFVMGRQENLKLQAGEDLPGLQILMNRGGSISGDVQDSMGKPIVEATIIARPVQPPGPPHAAVKSGADGTFVVNNTTPGLFELECESPGYCKVSMPSVRDIATGVKVHLVKEAIFSGKLIDDSTSQPIKKFKLRARPSESNHTARQLRSETFRADDGAFEVKGLTPGPWDMEFTAENVAPVILHRVLMKEGETLKDQLLHATQGAMASGKVKSTNEKPVSNALVRLEFVEPFVATDKSYTKLQSTSDSSGEYHIRNLVPGRYRIWASHPLFAPSGEQEIEIKDGPETRTDFTLPRPASLRVIVRDASGNTVPNATASLFQGDSPFDSATKISQGGMTGLKLPTNDVDRSGIGNMSDADAHHGFNVPVNKSGELTWHRKQPGEWTLQVKAPGFDPYTKKLQLDAGKETVDDAVLKVLDPNASPKDQIAKHGRKKQGDQARKKANAAEHFEKKFTPEEQEILKKAAQGKDLTPDEQETLKRLNAEIAQAEKETAGKAKKAADRRAKKNAAPGANPPNPNGDGSNPQGGKDGGGGQP